MLRSFNKLALLAFLGMCCQCAWGFALIGPNNEAYQIPEIGYNPLPRDGLPIAPKNLGEEYRRNTPVIFYSYDANFLDYFGSNGVAAVDSAIAVFNNVTNVSSYSQDLHEFPTQVTRENYMAEALFLLDMKSLTMHALTEQLGLTEPERYTWTLRDRGILPGATCPGGMEYMVIQRNFDPVISALNQFQTSSYVNGTLYSYYIREICQNGPPLAEALEFQVDPLDFSFTSVAAFSDPSLLNVNPALLSFGRFYSGLTRDDVGGLRYLIRPDNVNFESAGPNTLAEVTNPVPQLLFTSNLTLFAAQALTNTAGNLQALYPDLSIINSSNYFVNVLVTNVTPFFTNQPWMPVGSTVLMFATNLVPTIQTRFVHTFGNLLVLQQVNGHATLVPLTQVNLVNGRAFITIETDEAGTVASPFGPVGSVTVTTNSTFSTFLTNALIGDFVILPTNLCAVDIIAPQLTWVTTATNFLGAATNSLTVTNTLGFTNAGTVLSISQSEITYFTNHAFVVLPVNCVASSAELFEGVDRIQFVRRDFDSLLGRYFAPITNRYTLNSITNNMLVPEPILRTVIGPDILFSAQDLANNPDSLPGASSYGRGVNFNTTFAGPGLAGPGTIEGSGGGTNTVIVFNKVGPIFFNSFPNAFLIDSAEANQFPILIYGSYDGTTNAPIVYPDGTSVQNLMNQLVI